MPVKGMPVKAPPPAPVLWSWSGFYIGAHAGYGWGRDPFNDPRGDFVLTDIDSKGFVGGFHAGGNWQMGAFVGGLEIDLSGTDIKASKTGGASFGGGDFTTTTLTDKFELLGSARTRIGFLPWPNVLVYGTGGLAWTRFVQSEVTTSSFGGGTDTSTFTNSNPSWLFGWVAGGGVEARLWETNWLARVEYLHYDFGDQGSSFSNSGPEFQSGNLTVDVVRAGLSYKFGQQQVAAAAPVMPVKAPAAAAPWSWSGYYLGGHAGYGWGRDPRSDAFFGSKAPEPPPDLALFSDINARGVVGGFQAGANWQMANWVAGLEIDLSATGIKGSTTATALDGSFRETITDRFRMLGSARARLGSVLLWPSVLFYGTGGLAWTRREVEDVTIPTDGSGARGSTRPSWLFGWVAGVGGEARLWNTNWLARLEYLHYDFGDRGNAVETIAVNNPPMNISVTTTTGHVTADVVRAGLSFKLD